MERTKHKKTGNKGFSLIELIIVIAIMAILIGIVGTQVIPYLNKAREAKDMQIINSYCTAAVTAYATNAERFVGFERGTNYNTRFYGEVFGNDGMNKESAAYYWIKDINDLVGYGSAEELRKAMSSAEGRTIENVKVIIDFGFSGTITVQAIDGSGKNVFEPVTAYIGKVPALEEDID